MKTLRRMMMAMFAIATIGLTVACQKDDSEPVSGDTNGSIVGNWTVDKLSYNGSAIATDSLQMFIDVNENGTGAVRHQQATATFTWTKTGTTLTISPDGMSASYTYTITKLTDTEANLVGTVVPIMGLEGDVTIHMVKDATPGDDPGDEPGDDPGDDPGDEPGDDPGDEPGDDPANFPAATAWVYNYTTETFNIEYQGMTVPASIQLAIDLTFDATGNTGSMVMTGTPYITIPYVGAMPLTDYAMTETATFTYTYDAATATGVASGSMAGTASETVPFSYNAADNTIQITLPSNVWTTLANDIPEDVEFPISSLPTNLVFTRVSE